MDLAEKAERTLREFVPVIDQKIAGYFETELHNKFGYNARQREMVRQALEHTKEYILRPTKRLRGSFVYYGSQLGGGTPNWEAAVGVELVHAALLMHDDFMDQDEVRRKGPTTHEFYRKLYGGNLHLGEAMAVSVGDAVLCLGFELIADTGNISAIKQTLRGIANTGYGQAYDISLEALDKWTEEDVIVLHRAKTGIYTYENPLLIGADLAGVGDDAKELLKKYAEDGGVAFQLQDDILGVYGDPEKTGKSADSDLKQGKCTLMALKSLERPEVRKVWGNKEATKRELDAAKIAIRDCGAYEYNKKLAQEYAARAAKTAEKLRGLNLNSEAIDYIQGIAEYMVRREV